MDYFGCQDSLSFWDPAKSRRKSASSTTIHSGMNLMVLAAGAVGEMKSLGGDPLLFFMFIRSHSSISLWQLQTLQVEQYSMSLVCFTHIPRVRKSSCHKGQLQISEFDKFSSSRDYTWNCEFFLKLKPLFWIPYRENIHFLFLWDKVIPMKNLVSSSYLWKVVHACLKNNYMRIYKKVLVCFGRWK